MGESGQATVTRRLAEAVRAISFDDRASDLSLASPTIGPARAEKLVAVVRNIDSAETIREITALSVPAR